MSSSFHKINFEQACAAIVVTGTAVDEILGSAHYSCPNRVLMDIIEFLVFHVIGSQFYWMIILPPELIISIPGISVS